MSNTANKSFTGLNDTLIAKFFALKRSDDMQSWIRDESEPEVSCPLTQAGLELAATWQSPFEGAGIESKFPAIAQMAQAGMFSSILKAIGDKAKGSTKEAANKLEEQAKKLVGRSGVTKLNSTQVFSGMPPAKIQLTAFFKAFSDPQSEVEDPIEKLMSWSLPQRLAPDGVIAEAIRSDFDALSLMPSLVPKCIGFSYKRQTFKPMVIESISYPLDAPSDRHGRRVSALIQMTLCSLTALDKDDWKNTYTAI